ncbi:MAG: carboxylesterase/lipase family protein [Candidatus Thorarchaeota archaeon]
MVIVSTTKGKIKGVQEKNYQYFYGIPYAKPPIEELRFCNPQPMESWDDVKDTTKFRFIAPQNQPDTPPIGSEESEDCLYLNVWTPKADDKRRPVMFWIHGGGFIIGGSTRNRFNGARLAVHGDVVVVNFNYRLGVFGFLSLPDIPPNLGIADQIAALKWVKENIKNFGGDQNNITIFGESAGGMSVSILLSSPKAKGLFQKAVMQSGAAGTGIATIEQAKKGVERFLTKLQIKQDEIDLLRGFPTRKLIRVQKKFASFGNLEDFSNPFTPFIDGDIIPENPIEIMLKGASNDVPIMMGFNKDELGFIADILNKSTEEGVNDLIGGFRTNLEKRKLKNLDNLINVYRSEIEKNYPESRYKYWEAIISDSMFRVPIIKQLEAHISHNPDAYCYIFSYESHVSGYSFHTLEIPFVFGNLDTKDIATGYIEINKNTEKLSKNIMDAWVAFARTGDPNHEGLPEWPRYDIEKRATMILGTEPKVEYAPGDIFRKVWENTI